MRKVIKERIRKIAYSIFSIANICIPKKNRVFIYGGKFPEANSEAMLRYLSDNTTIEVIYVANNKYQYILGADNIVFKNNTHINALIACLTSKVVLDSSLHTIKMKPARGQLILQMWHGSPLKKLPKDTMIDNGKYYSYVFYSAEMFKNELMNALSVDENKMMLASNPRNDYLFKKTELPKELDSNGKKILWLPTFRRGIGLVETEKDIPIVSEENISELEELLKKENMTLYVKLHPLQENGLNDLLKNSGLNSIRLITDKELIDCNITLYEFLGQMDALLTDYSSVYFDYLLINRPIGFIVEDLNEYRHNRGFALNPPEDYMPGEKITSFQQMKQFFIDVRKGEDRFIEKRLYINSIANYYKDNASCERCAEIIISHLD